MQRIAHLPSNGGWVVSSFMANDMGCSKPWLPQLNGQKNLPEGANCGIKGAALALWTVSKTRKGRPVCCTLADKGPLSLLG